ncbi:MAG: helicase-related protein [Candidatus Limiplasma sp.]|nr:helicase-related protein [Candidatus Limiplasma sp.]
MEIFDNVNRSVRDDFAKVCVPGSRISIAAACFSMYAYQELKEQLEGIEQLRFIFTAQTFTAERTPNAKREFYIPRLQRERTLYGSEFEVKLRNELSQKTIAKECAEWIKRKVTFKSNQTGENMGGFINVESKEGSYTYMPINGFTTVDIGCERGNNTYNMVTRIEAPHSGEFIKLFDTIWKDATKLQDVTQEVLDSITAAYQENSPDFIYFVALYNIFHEFLEDVSEDVLPNEANGFKESVIWGMLYDFQKDAVLAIINKLETYNGCILADSVGLGKTFTALAVIKYYENRNKSVLVLCPKKLTNNWNTYKDNYVNNPIAKDRLHYNVLYHTDLSRDRGTSNGLDLNRLNWGAYDLVVIDESHNFRNGGQSYGEDDDPRDNRYNHLLNRVIRAGVPTKVLMLSATPVNNRFYDLRNQIALAYEGRPELISGKLNIHRTIDEVFRGAQKSFNAWSKMPEASRSTDALLRTLDFDFFEVLDSVTIARSRKHIQKYYNTKDVGTFPERRKPVTLRPGLTDLTDAASYNGIYALLNQLNLRIYTPTAYIFPSKLAKYDDGTSTLNQAGREQGIRRLMSINLLKRLESSVHAFRLTLSRIKNLMDETVQSIDSYRSGSQPLDLPTIGNVEELDEDDQNTELFTIGKKVKIDLADMDYQTWRSDLSADLDTLDELSRLIRNITPQHDEKLQQLQSLIAEKMTHPINDGNHKILIFSAFSDTAEYLYEHVSAYVKETFGLDTALVTGDVEGRTSLPKLRADLNTVLTLFSPKSKDKQLLMPNSTAVLDVLIATDCISEGQNLQDCDFCVNYDIHWNPVRIIQRFGRIDRIGSTNRVIQLVNFWPDLSLDEYINLKSRVETRMRISIMTSTGDDDLINPEEKGDLEYRKRQLQTLQDTVLDIEDMATGISIMDLGLNEFRLDLLDYMKHRPDVERAPHGMHAVVAATEDAPPGVVYVLRNINGSVNIAGQNQLHPFYLVYMAESGAVVVDHLSPKKLLDKLRLLCRGHAEPNARLCSQFNRDTKDGKDMRKYSALLGDTISSILQATEQTEIDSLFRPGGTAALTGSIQGLNDFELICFFVVK